MANFFTDNKEIQFNLNHKVDFDRLYELMSAESKEVLGVSDAQNLKDTWFEVLSILGDMAANEFFPNAKKVESQPISLEDGVVKLPAQITKNMAMLSDAGFHSMGPNQKFGGLGSPFVVDIAAMEILNRACPSTSLNACWWGPISHIIEEFGDDTIAKEYCTKIVEDRWSGNMALTEPDAGSDLGALRTYGVACDDGSYRLHGTKRFISNGDGEISLVLARKSKEDTGLGSLSLYLCPKTWEGRPNYVVSKIEEKLGLHGSATCELNYDGSKAFLLGTAGDGFKYMLVLMNEARLGVSFQAIGLLEAVYQTAKDYAESRKSWGQPLNQHGLIKEMLRDMEVDLSAVRSLGYKAGYQYTVINLIKKKLKDPGLSDDERSELKREMNLCKRNARKWNPLLKYYTAEICVAHARKGLQIHGGYGFTKEYDIERLLRESIIYPIYEGTSQIQALMCVKDTLKDAVRKPSDLIEASIGLRLKGLATGSPLRRELFKLKKIVNSAVLTLIIKMVKNNMSVALKDFTPGQALKYIKALGGMLKDFEDFSLPLLHAERICLLKCYESLAENLVEDTNLDHEKIDAAKWFLRRAVSDSLRIKNDIETLDISEL